MAKIRTSFTAQEADLLQRKVDSKKRFSKRAFLADIQQQVEKPKKRSKYGNHKVGLDGFTFDSKKERDRYVELKHYEWASEIIDLELQPKFDLIVNGIKVCAYRADFRYKRLSEQKTWIDTVEDVKGFKTSIYRLKFKLMKACLGITIVEI